MGSSMDQIVNWRTSLKFPQELKLSREAKHLMCRLLCDVDHRLGTGSIDEIKVWNYCAYSFNLLNPEAILVIL